jgi:small subunit ribosomal protein S21
VQVLVPDNSIGQALKVLQKKMQREGIFREMKLRGHYEKPSERRVREKAKAAPRASSLAARGSAADWVIPGAPRKGGPRAPRF